MIFNASVTTPANTAEADAQRTTFKLTRGLVWMFEVDFPPGCVGLVHLRIFDGKYQVLPASPTESLVGEGVVLRYDDLYMKDTSPFEFVLETWNLDEVYPHTLQVRVGLAASDVFISHYLPSVAYNELQASLQAAALHQQEVQATQMAILLASIKTG